MSENKNSMLTSALTYGAYLGLALIVISVLLYLTNLSFESWAAWISYAVMGAGIYFASVKYRNEVLGGVISYGGALGFGVLVAVFAGVISSFYSYIFMTFIDTEFINQAMEIGRARLEEQGQLSDEQIDQAMEAQQKFMTPGMMVGIGVLGMAFVGLIISLITSIFVKKEEKPFDFTKEN